MNSAKIEHRLRVKEHELLSTLAGLESGARASGEHEVRDSMDDATSAQISSESLDEATVLTHTLMQVRNSLQRLGEGNYGKCVSCGRAIERARLEAIPWTTYCLEDQEKQDQKQIPSRQLVNSARSQSA